MIDLDNFKELNDFFGHDFGDKVLINFAEKLKSSSDSFSYLCGRLGGDEFVVFGCKKSLDLLLDKIERLFGSISGENTIGKTSFQLTASMGIAIKSREEEKDFYQLLKDQT